MNTKNYPTCLVCGSSNIELLFECSDHFVSHENFELAKCSNCGFIFTGNAPKQSEIAAYYKSDAYISHSNTQKGLINKMYHIVRNLMLRKKWRLISRLSKGKVLLDIGCGTGYFPNYMKQKGYESYGMEIDENARKFAAENFGIKVSSPDELLTQSHKSAYDIITLWHVLEHIYDTDTYMNWIHESLKDDGTLLIAIPNCSSYDAKTYKKYWAAYDVPRHIWHFTPDTLNMFISTYKFRLVAVKRLPFDSYYNSLMSARYAGKRISLVHGFVIGMLSNLKSFFLPKKASSIIYVLKK